MRQKVDKGLLNSEGNLINGIKKVNQRFGKSSTEQKDQTGFSLKVQLRFSSAADRCSKHMFPDTKTWLWLSDVERMGKPQRCGRGMQPFGPTPVCGDLVRNHVDVCDWTNRLWTPAVPVMDWKFLPARAGFDSSISRDLGWPYGQLGSAGNGWRNRES